MIDGSENRNRQLAFELQNSHVCEKRSKKGSLAWLVTHFNLKKQKFPWQHDALAMHSLLKLNY